MTNREAIEILGQYDVSDLHFYTTDGEEIPFPEWSDAIEVAISALQAQDLQQLATDTISRQAAIDAVENTDCELSSDAWDEITDAIMQVPSTQPEPFHINLNEWVKVKLTDLGKEIYYHQYDELNKAYGMEVLKPYFPSEDEDGYTRFQLWEFTQLYGAHIGMGAPNVIDPLEIVCEVEINA